MPICRDCDTAVLCAGDICAGCTPDEGGRVTNTETGESGRVVELSYSSMVVYRGGCPDVAIVETAVGRQYWSARVTRKVKEDESVGFAQHRVL